MSKPSLLRRKVIDPLKALLRQGVSPGQLAWSVALGVFIAIIPVLGVTTLLCTLVALSLRLNLIAIQVANWLAYPLQIVLILPFFRLGERLFHQTPIDLSPAELLAMIQADAWGSIQALWTTTLHGLVAWLLVGLPLVLLAQRILVHLFRLSAQHLAHQPVTTGSTSS